MAEEGFSWEDLLMRYKVPIIIALCGVILVGGGILAVLVSGRGEEKIEIISSEETKETQKTIFVDIEGAVENPGVYELEENSRLENLLVAAGGLSVEADREWMAKFLNRAQKLTDGAKIYIPKTGETTVSKDIKSDQTVAGEKTTSLVNVNTASSAELDKLWGIGPVTAAKIIDNRPYQMVEELSTRKILKKNVYERNKDLLTVF